MKKIILALSLCALALSACQRGGPGGQSGGAGGTRDQNRIVGSSTVYPFTTAVAEQFVRNNPTFKAPITESTGTGGGMKLFCAGVGVQHPDIEDASRQIKKSEFEDCTRNGVKQIIEVPIGIDGIALMEGKNNPSVTLTQADVYKALAANPFGKPNTAKTWKDVNPALPATEIRVYGPPPTSGTRDAFAELIMQKGCETDPAMKAMKDSDPDKQKEICTKIREDGAYIERAARTTICWSRRSPPIRAPSPSWAIPTSRKISTRCATFRSMACRRRRTRSPRSNILERVLYSSM